MAAAAQETTSGSSAPAAMASEAADGPVLSMMSKRLRALRKKYNRILQMEERLAQGRSLNKEQEDVLRSKPAVAALIDEYEKLRLPLSVALQEELSLARPSPSPFSFSLASPPPAEAKPASGEEAELQRDPEAAVEDLLNLLYFGCLFDVRPQTEFASMMFTRTHERESCLTYDYVTDDSTGFLQEGDLDLISALGSLIISRPAHSEVSHKKALLGCVQHAKLWLRNADQPIQPGSAVTYAGLTERLKRILASDYFTTTPELKAPVDVVAAVGKYAAYQVQVPDSAPQPPSLQDDESPAHSEGKVDNSESYEVKDSEFDHYNTINDGSKDESDVLDSGDANVVQHEQHRPLEDEQCQKDTELVEQQYVPRRSYQSQRGNGRGGGDSGRRGYGNGRGSRGGRGGGGYQNGRSQYYDPGYYPGNYYNPRGRGGRIGASAMYNHAGATHGGHVPGNIELGASS